MSSGLIVALELALVLGVVLGLAFLELWRLRRDLARTAGAEDSVNTAQAASAGQSANAGQSADAEQSARDAGHAKR